MRAEGPILVARREGEVPEGDGWLGPRERAVQSEIPRERRLRDWRRGRWAAKLAVCRARPGLVPDDVEILAAEDGAPEAYVGGERLLAPLSISHKGEMAIAAIGPEGTRLGCDLERVEPRSDGFLRDFFLPSERSSVEACGPEARAERANLIWSAKESALKAIREGLRRDTRSVEVLAIGGSERRPGWRELRVRDHEGGALLTGWWCERGGIVLSILSDRPEPPPRADGEPWASLRALATGI